MVDFLFLFLQKFKNGILNGNNYTVILKEKINKATKHCRVFYLNNERLDGSIEAGVS